MRTRWTHRALAAAMLVGWAGIMAAPCPARDVTTFHYDNKRTGWNSEETILKLDNVSNSTFGKLWYARLDGQVYAAPLVISGLNMGGSNHDVVFAATENNTVYALDANSGAVLWKNHVANAVTQSQFNASCPNVNPLHGITSTPVIDRAKNVIYVCALVSSGGQKYQIYALDVVTGEKKEGYPIPLQGKDRTLTFNALQNTQRGALTLHNGILYSVFSSRCDIGEWHGWVIGLPVNDLTKPQQFFTPSLTESGSGIWGTAGPSVDDNGNLVVVTGNGSFNMPSGNNLGESFVRIKTSPTLSFSKQRTDYYTPTNFDDLNRADLDMGGSSAIALPDHVGSETPHLVVAGGKDGLVYLVDRDNMGGLGAPLSFASMNAMMRSTPSSYVDDAGQLWVFATAENYGQTGSEPRGVAGFRVTIEPESKKSRLEYEWTSKRGLQFPGTSTVSSAPDGKDGITWVIETGKNDQHNDRGGDGALLAFNAKTGAELYASSKTTTRDGLGEARKFTAPIVANGRVYLAGGGKSGTNNHGVASYGLLPAKGDVYSDGTMNVTDVILTLQGMVGLTTLSSVQQTAADYNGDGKLNVADAVAMLIKIVTTD